MIKYIMSRRLYQRALIGLGACVVVFLIGYYVLEHISTMEDPPLGNTIYILIGSAFVFCSGLGVILIRATVIKKTLPYITLVGKYSLYIYLFHIYLSKAIFNHIFGIFFGFVLTLLSCLLIGLVIEKIKKILN